VEERQRQRPHAPARAPDAHLSSIVCIFKVFIYTSQTVLRYVSGYPMSLKGLECPVSKLANSGTRPRPTTHRCAGSPAQQQRTVRLGQPLPRGAKNPRFGLLSAIENRYAMGNAKGA
jgi:hypothetical protein